MIRRALVMLVAAGSACQSPSPRISQTTPWQLVTSAAPAGPQDVWTATASGVTSTWYLDIAGERVTVALSGDLPAGRYTGSAIAGDGSSVALEDVEWDARSGALAFRRPDGKRTQWILGRSVEGVFVGRVSRGASLPASFTAFVDHVSGWNADYFGRDLVPRTFDLEIAGNLTARLHIDRDASGALVGRFKTYVSRTLGTNAEEVEYDVTMQAWDGNNLRFVRTDPAWEEVYSLVVSGRTLVGTMTNTSSDSPRAVTVTGWRSELLSDGLAGRMPRATWQPRVRRQLAHLIMADAPAPLTTSVTLTPTTITPSADGYAANRDDAPAAHPPDYTVEELSILVTLPNPYGGLPLSRAIHGILGTPTTPPPPGGFPVVMALNGHGGSARGTFDAAEPMYWYADAWCRRGFVVLSLDVGHRLLADRSHIYSDLTDGDDPRRGNGPHPAIAIDALDSDWQESGERVWDVMRGIDFLTTRSNLDMSRLMITGLSMGAEVATLAGALDPRIRMVLSAGYVPDLAVMTWHANHPCWLWSNGAPTDYYAVADLHALIAPRPLLAEAGTRDNAFSDFAPPFVSAKEVTRRSRTAYQDVPGNFVFYLHDDKHAFHFGDMLAQGVAPPVDVTTPSLTGPTMFADVTWAADPTVMTLAGTLVDQVQAMLPPAQ
jgi:dienelactone hydrolase